MCKRATSPMTTQPPLHLSAVSEWRVWRALAVYFTVLLNRQIRRRWLLEQKCMHDQPVCQRFRPVIFLEPVPSLRKPQFFTTNAVHSVTVDNQDKNEANLHDPFNIQALEALKTRVRLLRARVEKGKELASEIERRLLDPSISFPPHFCHTCVVGGKEADILLTKCGHRVCLTCLAFGVGADGAYECSICLAPTDFVTRSPLSSQRSGSEQMSSVSRQLLKPKRQRAVGSAASALVSSLVKPS